MKVSCSHIRKLLKPSGFVIRQSGGIAETCGFVKEDGTPSLFQQIDVSFAGRRSEAALAHLTVSVTKWIRVKGLSTSRLFGEIASDDDRGWSVIITEDEAQTWEATLTRLGPIKVSELASEAGPALLERTCDARSIARALLSRLDRQRSIRDQFKELEGSTPAERVAEAKKLAEWPGVMQAMDSEQIYFLACLAVLSDRDSAVSMGLDPLRNDFLMAKIQLVADGIIEIDRNIACSK
jgi:hypothetical protein